MSYRAGVGPGIPGFEPGPPRITCDGCGMRLELREDLPPPVWFLGCKGAPGWRTKRHDDGRREDTCPTCRKAAK